MEMTFLPAKSPASRALLLIATILLLPALACSRTDATPYETVAATATFTASPTATSSPTLAISSTATATKTVFLTPTPMPTTTFPPTPTRSSSATPSLSLYYSQAGDTLRTVAVRFAVLPSDIRKAYASDLLPEEGLINPNVRLLIPMVLTDTTKSTRSLPDSAVVYSPALAKFDVNQYVKAADGYLAGNFPLRGSPLFGGELLRQVAFNNSFSPKLLLALLQNASGWVTEKNPAAISKDYPLGLSEADKGLHAQLIDATNRLSIGYYGWRDASLLELAFRDGSTVRLAPDLNAGSVAIMYYFSRLANDPADWQVKLNSFLQTYQQLWGNPFDNQVEPLFYSDLPLEEMDLPFASGQKWAFTGGPHGAWEHDGARAALDFAPPTAVGGCQVSPLWATAVASGLVVRSFDGVVVIDLDGDGLEQTGWNVLYLHIAREGRVAAGTRVERGDPIGHPSCEGGIATGSHIHVARKYNGEWMLAGGPVPFILSGWTAHAGAKPYEGTMTRGDEIAVACPCGSYDTLVGW